MVDSDIMTISPKITLNFQAITGQKIGPAATFLVRDMRLQTRIESYEILCGWVLARTTNKTSVGEASEEWLKKDRWKRRKGFT